MHCVKIDTIHYISDTRNKSKWGAIGDKAYNLFNQLIVFFTRQWYKMYEYIYIIIYIYLITLYLNISLPPFLFLKSTKYKVIRIESSVPNVHRNENRKTHSSLNCVHLRNLFKIFINVASNAFHFIHQLNMTFPPSNHLHSCFRPNLRSHNF